MAYILTLLAIVGLFFWKAPAPLKTQVRDEANSVIAAASSKSMELLREQFHVLVDKLVR
jgi:hypothetical protein